MTWRKGLDLVASYKQFRTQKYRKIVAHATDEIQTLLFGKLKLHYYDHHKSADRPVYIRT